MTNPALSPENLGHFLRRFYNCYDGLVRRVEITLASPRDTSEAVVALSVRDDDAAAEQDEGWVNLVFKISGLDEFALAEGAVTHRVLSNGLTVGWYEDLVFLDFAGYKPGKVEEVRRSGFYLAGRSCTWRIEPYRESML